MFAPLEVTASMSENQKTIRMVVSEIIRAYRTFRTATDLVEPDSSISKEVLKAALDCMIECNNSIDKHLKALEEEEDIEFIRLTDVSSAKTYLQLVLHLESYINSFMDQGEIGENMSDVFQLHRDSACAVLSKPSYVYVGGEHKDRSKVDLNEATNLGHFILIHYKNDDVWTYIKRPSENKTEPYVSFLWAILDVNVMLDNHEKLERITQTFESICKQWPLQASKYLPLQAPSTKKMLLPIIKNVITSVHVDDQTLIGDLSSELGGIVAPDHLVLVK